MKRVISLILSLVLLVGMVPVAAQATESDNISMDNGNMTVEGTNGFGMLLSNDIAQQQAGDEGTDGYNVLGLTIEGNLAVVEYDSLEEAVLVVSLYSEDGMQMLLSGHTTVDPEANEATVKLEGEMPEYFMASAYLLDTYDYSPLCPSYDTPMYTREMQELLASTVDDYEEDRVLQFSEDKTTNFAVYAEGTQVIREQSGVNTVISADDDTMTYVIGNADEQITGLQAGDVFVYPYGDDELLIVKVASVKMNGTTATIQGTDVEMEEVFSHVKMEQIGDTGDIEVDESTCPDGVVYEGMSSDGPSTYSLRAAEGGFGEMYALNYKFLEDKLAEDEGKYFEGDVTLSGKIGISLDITFDYYVSLKRQFLEFKTDVGIKGEIKLEGSGKFKIPLGNYKFRAYGVGIGFEPEFQIEVKASVALEFFAGFTFGVAFEMGKGFRDLTGKPKVEADFKVEGSVFIGIDLSPVIELAEGAVIEAELSAPVGFELEAELKGTDFEKVETNAESIHDCKKCVEMELKLKAEVSAKIKFLNMKKLEFSSKKTKLSIKIGDLYWLPTANLPGEPALIRNIA